MGTGTLKISREPEQIHALQGDIHGNQVSRKSSCMQPPTDNTRAEMNSVEQYSLYTILPKQCPTARGWEGMKASIHKDLLNAGSQTRSTKISSKPQSKQKACASTPQITQAYWKTPPATLAWA